MEHNKSARHSGRASNFRTSFIRSFVSDSAESSRFQIEEQILSEDADVDLVKLAQFAARYQLPSNLRVSIWKLLLDVDSCYSETKKVVALHRKEEADVLLNSLMVMRALSTAMLVKNGNTEDLSLKSIDIIRMIELGNGEELACPSTGFDIKLQAQLAIAKQMLIACKQEWRDAFWLTKTFDELVASVFSDNVLQKAVWETRDKLEAIRDNSAISIMNEHCLWSRIPFSFWFRSAGATMFSHEVVLKLWDKVCSCTKEGLLTLLKLAVETYILEVSSQIVKNFEDDKKDVLEVTIAKETEVALMSLIFENFLSSGRFPVRR
uniref:Rab-GAP TBC domain-containing protein n=1 Tax=Syphacia muris TaxID=451379 RepID=A0A0N5AXM8_9BILA